MHAHKDATQLKDALMTSISDNPLPIWAVLLVLDSIKTDLLEHILEKAFLSEVKEHAE